MIRTAAAWLRRRRIRPAGGSATPNPSDVTATLKLLEPDEKSPNPERVQLEGDGQNPPPLSRHIASIHTAIATIMTFSVNDTNPSGTLLDPPTQAHLSSRRST